MIVTTTPYIEGRHISEYKGIVTQKAGVDSISFSSSGEAAYKRAYISAENDIQKQAADMGANAIVGVQINDNVATICVTGTAVLIE